MSSKSTKKPGLMSRLFSRTSISGGDGPETEKEKNKQRLQRLHSVDVTTFRDKNSSGFFEDSLKVSGGVAPPRSKSVKDAGKGHRKQSVPVAVGTAKAKTLEASSKATGSQSKTAGRSSGSGQRKLRHRKKGGDSSGVKVDTSKPLEFPATPEMIYEYHKRKPFLNKNEEWLVMELNEFECLVDSLEIIQIIAKHSKFFEVEPDELWEEFFEFMEDVPSYDEMINYDVWQEFRDNKYPC